MSSPNWQSGAALADRVIASVSAEAMHGIAEVLEDPNPIHLDPAAARALGLGDRVVNQGPANVGYVLDMLAENFPAARVRALEVQLRSQVYGGDRVVAGGRVLEVTDGPEGTAVTCEVWLDRSEGQRAVDGSATMLIAAETQEEENQADV